jgi:tRNA1Val (adenine37-N6)-methyltransferase
MAGDSTRDSRTSWPAVHPQAPAEPDELGELTDDAIAGPFRIEQRRHGHRYSLDDVLTAWEAARAVEAAAEDGGAGPQEPAPPRRCLELGSGVGSVLLMLAYKLPDARFVAVVAQRNSFQLLARNVARNGLEGRVELLHGDLRAQPLSGEFDLVTGTPPYVPPGMATPSPDAQRAYARQEYRGGVEAYVEAAARVLAPRGRLVVCADARYPARVLDSARTFGLSPLRRRDVVPREGSAALFSVFTLARADEAPVFEHEPPWVARDASGARTPAYHEVRAFFGMAAPDDELPSP